MTPADGGGGKGGTRDGGLSSGPGRPLVPTLPNPHLLLIQLRLPGLAELAHGSCGRGGQWGSWGRARAQATPPLPLPRPLPIPTSESPHRRRTRERVCGENSPGNSWGGGPGPPSWVTAERRPPPRGDPIWAAVPACGAGAGDLRRPGVDGGQGRGGDRSPWWVRTVRQPIQQLCRLANARRPPTLPVSTVLHRVWSPPAGEG